MRIRYLLSALLAVPLLLPAMRPAAAAPPGCGPAAPAALSEFFDRSLPGRNVPGAVVSVVAGGKTVFTKGYGVADTEHAIPFDPERSLVRIASITKLFTWTAVMQQVEAGKLDLNADVNTYLTKFRVPATYPQPVTLLTLMNHTAGFEERVIGVGARTPADVPDLGDYLAANMPARIRPPGEMSAYSNYGAALAGYIVAQVSGEPWDQYVQHHIFEPLGMAHSTATEPVPAPLDGDLARSYDSDTGERIPFIFDRSRPDGTISTTAADVARFMVAHLDGGPILQPATLARMQETSFTADPKVGGYAHGFETKVMNGHRLLMHGGSWEGFESLMILVPGCDLGLFISTNGTGGVEAVNDLLPHFFDAFAAPPAVPDTVSPAGPGLPRAPATAGFYQPARHNESSVEKLVSLLGPLRLTIDGAGTVHFKGQEWKPQGDGTYLRADGTDHLVFLTGTGGRRYAVNDGANYQLMDPAETLPVNLVVLLAFVVTALSGLAVLWRRRRRPSRAWRAARWLAAGAGLLGLVFLVLLALVLFGDTGDFLYGVPASFAALLALPVVVILATAAATTFTFIGWRGAGRVARVHQVVLLAGLGALTWFVWQWNLIGWQLG